jgi:hypothetical protein
MNREDLKASIMGAAEMGCTYTDRIMIVGQDGVFMTMNDAIDQLRPLLSNRNARKRFEMRVDKLMSTARASADATEKKRRYDEACAAVEAGRHASIRLDQTASLQHRGPGALECPVCLEEGAGMIRPVLINPQGCDHVCCEPCLGSMTECPMCRSKIVRKLSLVIHALPAPAAPASSSSSSAAAASASALSIGCDARSILSDLRSNLRFLSDAIVDEEWDSDDMKSQLHMLKQLCNATIREGEDANQALMSLLIGPDSEPRIRAQHQQQQETLHRLQHQQRQQHLEMMQRSHPYVRSREQEYLQQLQRRNDLQKIHRVNSAIRAVHDSVVASVSAASEAAAASRAAQEALDRYSAALAAVASARSAADAAMRPPAAAAAATIELRIRTLSHGEKTLRVNPAGTIGEAKVAMMEQFGFHCACRMIFNHVELRDDFKFSDYNIVDQSTVYLLNNLRGG